MKKIRAAMFVAIVMCFAAGLFAFWPAVQLLKDYDFDKGGYFLLGLRGESSEPAELADEMGDFYADDAALLKQCRKEWTFSKPSPAYACGFDYRIYLCKNGEAIESFYINLGCNEICSDKGYFFIEEEQLAFLKSRVKKPVFKGRKFKSIKEAREYREKILLEKRLIMAIDHEWMKFEGSFKFTYKCRPGIKDCFNNEKKLLRQITNEIKKAYPGEEFELDGCGGSRTDLSVEIRCNKSLEKKFKLYIYDRNSGWDKWQPYDLGLVSYWAE